MVTFRSPAGAVGTRPVRCPSLLHMLPIFLNWIGRDSTGNTECSELPVPPASAQCAPNILRKQSIIFWRLILGGEGLISIQFQSPFPSSHPQSDLQVKTPFSRLEEMCLPSTSTPGDERKYEEGTLSNLLGQNTMDDREKECYIWVPGSLCCTAQVDTMSISSTLIKLKKNSCLLRKKIKAKADTLTWKPASLVLDVSQVF